MELVFENKTFTLKSFNRERRLFLTENVFKFQFSAKPEEIRTQKFLTEFFLRVKKTIWQFIKDGDKTLIGVFSHFSETVEMGQIDAFLEWTRKQLEAIKKFVDNKIENKEAETMSRGKVLNYLISKTHWTKEYIDNLTEIEMYKILENLAKSDQIKNLDFIRKVSLGVAVGRGNKEAGKMLKEMDLKIKRTQSDEKVENARKTGNIKTTKNLLSKEFLLKHTK